MPTLNAETDQSALSTPNHWLRCHGYKPDGFGIQDFLTNHHLAPDTLVSGVRLDTVVSGVLAYTLVSGVWADTLVSGVRLLYHLLVTQTKSG